jgi:GNAT superfamily N-acetyltransferase
MNGNLQVRQADDARSRKRFIELPFRLYRNDPNWVPPLRSAQAKTLAGKTAFFDHAEMALFLAERSGAAIGRIAAIHNKAHSARYQDGVGFFGFFECDALDTEAAQALFGKAEGWLRARGLKTLRGPASPSMNDECGLLVDGFDRPPMAMMPYNPESYAGLLELLGLRKCKDLYAYLINGEEVRPGTEVGDRLVRLAGALRCRHPEVHLRSMNMRNYPHDILRFIGLFEEARRDNWGCVPLTENEILQTAAQMKRVIDPEIIILAEVSGRPAGALLAIPNVNRALAAVNGRLLPLGFLRFFRELRRVDEMRIFGVAVLKEYRHLGITAMLFLEEVLRGTARGYRLAEASWVLEDNQLSDKSIRNAFNPRRYKTFRIYEKPL